MKNFIRDFDCYGHSPAEYVERVCNDCHTIVDRIGHGDESWDICPSCQSVENSHEAYVDENGEYVRKAE